MWNLLQNSSTSQLKGKSGRLCNISTREHGSIYFNHLDLGDVHLKGEGNQLFAKNITDHMVRG